MVSQIVNFFNSIPNSFWVVIGSAVALSGVQELIKQFLVKDLAGLSNKTNATLMTALAFAASGIQYLTTSAGQNPTVLGAHTAVLVATMHLAYTFVVKPFVALLNDAKAYRATPALVPAATSEPVSTPAAG